MNMLAHLVNGADRPLVIEPMRRRHLPQVEAIEETSYIRGWSHRLFLSELEQVRDGRRWYGVSRRGRRVVGYGGLLFTSGEAHVTNLAVAVDQRRHGVGAALMHRLATTAIERGCQAWTLEVRATSTAAQQLYRNFGFTPAGVRKRYYENSIDAIVMWCHDIQSNGYAERLDRLASPSTPAAPTWQSSPTSPKSPSSVQRVERR